MLERILRFTAILLVGCVLLPGCSQMTHSGRQQAAYRRYQRTCAKNREKYRKKIAKHQARVPHHQVSDYADTSGVVDGPRAVPTGN